MKTEEQLHTYYHCYPQRDTSFVQIASLLHSIYQSDSPHHSLEVSKALPDTFSAFWQLIVLHTLVEFDVLVVYIEIENISHLNAIVEIDIKSNFLSFHIA